MGTHVNVILVDADGADWHRAGAFTCVILNPDHNPTAPQFTDEHLEAQRDQVTCPKPVAMAGIKIPTQNYLAPKLLFFSF